jgi:hypothetical protein
MKGSGEWTDLEHTNFRLLLVFPALDFKFWVWNVPAFFLLAFAAVHKENVLRFQIGVHEARVVQKMHCMDQLEE